MMDLMKHLNHQKENKTRRENEDEIMKKYRVKYKFKGDNVVFNTRLLSLEEAKAEYKSILKEYKQKLVGLAIYEIIK